MSPKKKPLTITERATAQYVIDHPVPAAPLLQYFPPKAQGAVTDGQLGKEDGHPKAQVAAKPTRRQSVAKTTKAITKRKGAAPQIVLLSPESALKRVENQDILFGTSSQLYEEESPRFLRDLQHAMKVSEDNIDPDPTNDSPYGTETPTKLRPVKSLRGALAAHPGSLWSKAARDSEGNLLHAEVIDLANSSPACPAINEAAPKEKTAGERSVALPLSMANYEASTQLTPRKVVAGEPLDSDMHKVSEQQCATHSNDEHEPHPCADIPLEERARSDSPAKGAVKTTKKYGTANSSMVKQKPEYEGFPTARLASELASYGFKPLKSRAQMIATLERCWESRNRVALQSLATNVNVQPSEVPDPADGAKAGKIGGISKLKVSPVNPKASLPSSESIPIEAEAPPKKPRGRPRKIVVPSATANGQPLNEARSKAAPSTPGQDKPSRAKRKPASVAVEEIDDSDTPPTPSPPRRRSSPITPRPLELRPLSAEQTPNLTPAAAQKRLFAHITKAITTFPRSTTPKHPTWHEKILMYDPIVLEDLAAWLNTEGLGRVGVDEEVGPAVVKAWCEERSVCCLWKENLRGGTRVRY